MNFKGYRRNLQLGVIIALCLTILIAGNSFAGKIMIPEGKEIKVRFDPNMEINSSNVSEGVPLLINLAEPIDIGGVIVVEKGAPGTATVVEVKKHGMVGKPGYIKIEFVDLEAKGEYQAPEGEKIKLSGFAEHKGKKKTFISILLGFGLLIKGGKGEISTTEYYTATVAESIILESE
jgi:hypothetical protein